MRPLYTRVTGPTLLLFFLLFACALRIAYVALAHARPYGKLCTNDVLLASEQLLKSLNVETNELELSASPHEYMHYRGRQIRIWTVDGVDSRGRDLTLAWNAVTGELISLVNTGSFLTASKAPILDSESAVRAACKWRSKLRLWKEGRRGGAPPVVEQYRTGWHIAWRRQPAFLIRLDKKSGGLMFAQAMD